MTLGEEARRDTREAGAVKDSFASIMGCQVSSGVQGQITSLWGDFFLKPPFKAQSSWATGGVLPQSVGVASFFTTNYCVFVLSASTGQVPCSPSI